MRQMLFLIGFCASATLSAGACATAVATPTPHVNDRAMRDLWRQVDLEEMEQLAESGDVWALRWNGQMLHNRGQYDEAIHWYARAVELGDGSSANRIAFFYEHGIGRPKDLKAAMSWHRKGAELGDFSSQVRYASALRSGTVLARNEKEAFRWYAKAAKEPRFQPGYAYLPLAEMYEEGTAVPQDLKRAYALAKAAELTVDSSDISSLEKARSLQANAKVRMTPLDQRAAEHLFQAFRPDLADRLERRSRESQVFWLVVILMVVATGAFLRWTIRRFMRKRSIPVKSTQAQ